MNGILRNLLSDTVLGVVAGQRRLDMAVGTQDWELDLDGGTIEFTTRRRGLMRRRTSEVFRISLLGTVSEQSNSWQWSWANADLVGHSATSAAERVRSAGLEKGIAELVAPRISLESASAAALAVVATSISGGAAFYRCPYDGGAGFVALLDPLLPSSEGSRVMELVSTVMTATAMVGAEFDHLRAIRSYAKMHPALRERPVSEGLIDFLDTDTNEIARFRVEGARVIEATSLNRSVHGRP